MKKSTKKPAAKKPEVVAEEVVNHVEDKTVKEPCGCEDSVEMPTMSEIASEAAVRAGNVMARLSRIRDALFGCGNEVGMPPCGPGIMGTVEATVDMLVESQDLLDEIETELGIVK